jgi:aminoglycoside phosphotransferase
LLQSRFFNFIELDEKNGIVTKKSQNKDKLNSEIDWYRSIPQKIKLKTPKIISYSEKQSHIIMEHIQFPTLAEVWLYGDANLKDWCKILEELKKVVTEFNGEIHQVRKQDYYQMYIEKTDKRINELLSKNSKFKDLFKNDKIVINGKVYKNWLNIKREIFYKIDALYNKDDNCLLHGDLCFSNILYDLNNNQYKLIDPRGKWGSSIFGDIKYDIAKLRHSIIGGYDSINNELFSIEYKKSKINLKVYRPSKYNKISRKFDAWVSRRWNLDDIKLIEGLLFISMLPLHQDNFKKQLAFYSIGIQRLNEVLVKKK